MRHSDYTRLFGPRWVCTLCSGQLLFQTASWYLDFRLIQWVCRKLTKRREFCQNGWMLPDEIQIRKAARLIHVFRWYHMLASTQVQAVRFNIVGKQGPKHFGYPIQNSHFQGETTLLWGRSSFSLSNSQLERKASRDFRDIYWFPEKRASTFAWFGKGFKRYRARRTVSGSTILTRTSLGFGFSRDY